MAQYERFLSYLFEYENDEKGMNCGFAKIEVRGETKRIQITVKGRAPVELLHVCGFYREGNRCICVPLGRMMINGGSGQFQYTGSGAVLRGTGIPFEQLRGLVLSNPQEKGRAYATVWDDEPFGLSMFEQEERQTEEPQPSEEQDRDEERRLSEGQDREGEQRLSEGQDRDEEPRLSEEQGGEGERPAEEEQKSVGQSPAKEQNGEELQRTEEEQKDIGQNSAEEQNGEELQRTEEVQRDVGQSPAEERRENGIPAEGQRQAELLQSDRQQADGERSLEEEMIIAEEYGGRRQGLGLSAGELTETAEQKADECWLGLCRRLKRIEALPNDSMTCLKAIPADIGRLPRPNWIFGNNGFLMYSYVRYRYIVFTRVSKYEFELWVPGTYGRNEELLAEMFGFLHFRSMKSSQVSPGDFGYWCVPLTMPGQKQASGKADHAKEGAYNEYDAAGAAEAG